LGRTLRRGEPGPAFEIERRSAEWRCPDEQDLIHHPAVISSLDSSTAIAPEALSIYGSGFGETQGSPK
jgi:hypothetical protein